MTDPILDRYTLGPLLSTIHEASTCHEVFGRHYHCANCGRVSGYRGHMLGDPPEFACEPMRVT